MRQIQSVNKRHQYVKNPHFQPYNHGIGVNSGTKLIKIVGIYKFLFVFFEFYVIFVDSREFWTHIGIKNIPWSEPRAIRMQYMQIFKEKNPINF